MKIWKRKVKCIESDCSEQATKKLKTRDGHIVHLCELHYRQWKGELRGEEDAKKERKQ